MQITASMVKELRERTGAGMMECKKALVETDGDMDGAAEHLRKTGITKADKKAGRIAAEGTVLVEVDDTGEHAALLEINSETDFVAKDGNFDEFARQIAHLVLTKRPSDMAALARLETAGGSVEEMRQALVAKVGENIQIRRFEVHGSQGGQFGIYRHGTRIGVLVELEGGNTNLAKDVAMHIAASRPVCVGEDQVPQAVLEKEREIFAAQAAESGKPPEIVDKMVQGRIKKFLGEITLLGQPFVKDPDQSVGKLLQAAGASVTYFQRFEVGEGIEKKQENFADEVMAQVKGN
ncbi:MAG: translation elongation factor Ts [Gammaproteobacteria bacterium]|nr:translation elongation factor Ts [Gammaproteobacteria bacterium]